MSGGLVVIAVWLVLIVLITALVQRRGRDRIRRRRNETWAAGEDGPHPRRAGCGGGGSCGGGCGGGG